MANDSKTISRTSSKTNADHAFLISPEEKFSRIRDRKSFEKKPLEHLLSNTIKYLQTHLNFQFIQFIYHDKGVPYAISHALSNQLEPSIERVSLNEFHKLFKKIKSSKQSNYTISKENEKLIKSLGYFLIHSFQLPSTNLLVLCSSNSFLSFEQYEIDAFLNFCSSFINTLSFQNETRLNLKKRELLNQLVDHFPLPLIQVDGELKSNINTEAVLADIGHHKKISLLGDLTNTLAHELSNPLFGISLCASTLECRDVDYQQVIEEIKKSSSRCVSIINQLKNIYTLNHETKLISLTELINDVCVIAKSETRGIVIEKNIHHPSTFDLIKTNPTFLHQILFNLLINAAQAIKANNHKNGHIRLSVVLENDTYIIKIIDNGGGVKPEFEPKLLRPFFSTKSKGTGLGLSICSRLIDKIGARFSIVNHFPRGLEAVVYIPK